MESLVPNPPSLLSSLLLPRPCDVTLCEEGPCVNVHFSREKADSFHQILKWILKYPQNTDSRFTPYYGSLSISFSKSPLTTEVNELSNLGFQIGALGP